ncbi:MAG: adenylate/guanylate cyclase domain-containing protein [Candidatus Muiribacteriota bacterium]
MSEEKKGFLKINKKKFSFKKIFIKLFLLFFISALFYTLFYFNILKKEYFSFLFEMQEIFSQIVMDENNHTALLTILAVFVFSNLILTFYLLKNAKGGGGGNLLELKSSFAKKEKEMDNMLKEMREEMNSKKVKFSSVLLRYRELLSSLDKEKIISIIFTVLEKSAGARRISLFLIDEHKEEIFMMKRYGAPVDKNLKIKFGEKNIIAHAVSEGKFFTAWQQDSLIQNLFKASPIQLKVIAPMFKEKVTGALAIEEFKGEDYELDEESKLVITTTASLAAIAFDKAAVFEMTSDELRSEKNFSKKQIEEKKALRNSFQKYTSPGIVEELLKNPDMLKLGGKKSELTVLFSDIVGFTTYSEKYPPEKVVSILNEYLTSMTDVIMEHNGTLDKFIGDEIMAVWGAPVPQENHVELAVRCGFSMLNKLKEMTSKWEKEGVEPFNIGIGINTGEMIVGNMGSPKRMDYTVIGDSVNTGARIESLTRQFKTSFIVSESTYLNVKDIVEGELLGKVTVKGKSKQIKVYKLNGLKE